ncbi:helix-turn-helix transcriptional regulator [Bacillus spongiae]|uniref:Helix-turn-helix transcriptional regulator n=1 Tax=Bacillus spongiae TaxID=2683610 RepID=A0ABU8HJ45_9BACI
MDENYKSIIGERLKLLRKKRKFEVNKIIAELDIARSTYTGWESGYRSPNGKYLVQLSKLFNTSVDYITGKTEDDSPIDADELKDILSKSKIKYDGKELTEEQAKKVLDLLEVYLK